MMSIERMLLHGMANYILPILESEFIKVEPEIQSELMADVKKLSDNLLLWLNSKTK
jgi:hypothetical protein